MRKVGPTVVLALTLLMVIGCRLPKPDLSEHTPLLPEFPFLEEDPTPLPVLSDLFFTGCAYLDDNDNGEVDEGDSPLGGIMITVELSSGGFMGGKTSGDNGCAFLTVPGGTKADYPASMTAHIPEDASMELLYPTGIDLEFPESRAEFLFAMIPEDG